jgi:SAM-dependent methyltransferase
MFQGRTPSMKTQNTIQRQYNEVIAPHYDLDPQSVTGSTLDRAADQILKQHIVGNGNERLKVLDVGAGTGMFLQRLKAIGGDQVEPYAVDLSEKMIECACRKIPELVAAVDDAANFDSHFPGESFDLICTHFITGFVPMSVLAPKIWDRLEEGGYWSYVGGTQEGYPKLQSFANWKILRCLCGGRALQFDNLGTHPSGRDEVIRTLEQTGFVARDAETYRPALHFKNLDEFLEFGYHGGWLTPFIETLGLHRTGATKRFLLNRLFFPVSDHHSIEIVLAQKVCK